MGRKRWLAYLLLFLMLFINLGTVPIWAGDGSGGGKGQPLAIVSSIPANGATGVSSQEPITVTFSKNVVYMTVREKNQKCFSLWRGQESVPAEIILADDQVEFEKRRDVVVKPQQPLQPGTTYRLEIAPQLESKSGVTLGEKTTISFTTAGIAANSDMIPKDQESASVLLPQAEPIASDITAVATAANPEKAEVSPTDSPAQSTEADTNIPAPDQLAEKDNAADGKSKMSPLAVIAITAAIIIAGIWWAYRRKNN